MLILLDARDVQQHQTRARTVDISTHTRENNSYEQPEWSEAPETEVTFHDRSRVLVYNDEIYSTPPLGSPQAHLHVFRSRRTGRGDLLSCCCQLPMRCGLGAGPRDEGTNVLRKHSALPSKKKTSRDRFSRTTTGTSSRPTMGLKSSTSPLTGQETMSASPSMAKQSLSNHGP